jgi:hypothetical protein
MVMARSDEGAMKIHRDRPSDDARAASPPRRFAVIAGNGFGP